MIGSSFSFIKKNNSNQNSFYFNSDFNLFNLKHLSIGCEYQFKDNNNLFSFQMNSSTIENSLGLIIRLSNQFDIGYSFVIPRNNELTTSQKIMIGINSDILNNYIK
jgi:hypothetical protein